MSLFSIKKGKVNLSACTLLLIIFFSSNCFALKLIRNSTQLDQDMYDNIVIGGNNITLDCQGNSIVGIYKQEGILIKNRSGITIKNCRISQFFEGIKIESSSVSFENIILERNILIGLNAQDNSRLRINGKFTSAHHGVFGVFFANGVNGTISDAEVLIEENGAGFQIGVNSSLLVSAVPPLPQSTIITQKNRSFGLTVVSNSHLFLFGLVDLQSKENGSNGVSIFTKSAMELDNGATVSAEKNELNGILLEDSAINMFNMHLFPGAYIESKDNEEAGLSISKASVFDMSDDATIEISSQPIGVKVDDGASVRLINSKIEGNIVDAYLTFGSRATFSGNEIETILCDFSALTRGDQGCNVWDWGWDFGFEESSNEDKTVQGLLPAEVVN